MNITMADSELVALSELVDHTIRTKLIASCVLFILTLASGYLPIRMIVNRKYIELAKFAGGGVLLATAFLHLIPKAHDNFKSLSDDTPQQHSNQEGPLTATSGGNLWNVPYPLELVLCCGFFFMYLAELLIARFLDVHQTHHDHHSQANMMENGGAVGDGQLISCAAIPTATTMSANNHQVSTGPIAAGTGAGCLYKFLSGLLIVFAFSLHSVFDGVAIGSQDSTEKVWTIFGAISCHKLIIAAVIGLELFAATLKSHFWTLLHLAIFSIMSPIGILLIVIAQSSFNINSHHPAILLIQSFATGTILYIIFVEILQSKLEEEEEEEQGCFKRKLAKCFSMIAGFLLMLTALSIITVRR